MDKPEPIKYSSYNAFGRVALLFGVPVIPLIIMAVLILGSGFYGVVNYGAVGLLPAILIFITLIAIRIKCADNPRALVAIWWHIRGALLLIQCRASIVSLTSMPNPKQRRLNRVREWIKDNSHSS